MSSTDKEWDEAKVFVLDEGFGNTRITVRVFENSEKFGNCITIFDPNKDTHISIDFDVWDRVTKAVARRREG